MPDKHVAVLYGGFSSERPVSLSSGEACAAGLERAGYKVTRVDVDRNLSQTLDELKPDVCLFKLSANRSIVKGPKRFEMLLKLILSIDQSSVSLYLL